MVFSRVCRLYTDQGVSFPLGKRALFKQLKDEGILTVDSCGKAARPKRVTSTSVLRLLWLDRAKVDGMKQVIENSRGEQMTMTVVDDSDDPF